MGYDKPPASDLVFTSGHKPTAASGIKLLWFSASSWMFVACDGTVLNHIIK